jgi:hypothetical protein
MIDNYFGQNTPTVLVEKAKIAAELTRLAKAHDIYDNEGGWNDYNLGQLSHELHYAGFDAVDEGALIAALVGYNNGVGSGVGAANYWKETGIVPTGAY